VITLLDLPQTSKAFTSLRETAAQVLNDGSASPPRKIARLDGDSDSSSASRSRSQAKGGVITLQITGEPGQSYSVIQKCFKSMFYV